MTLFRVLHLLWVIFILSAGIACGFVAWRTFKLRHHHRIFHYFGAVKTALFISTINSSWTIVTLIHERGLILFDALPFATYRNLICQTLVAVALWCLALYLMNKINGSYAPRKREEQ